MRDVTWKDWHSKDAGGHACAWCEAPAVGRVHVNLDLPTGFEPVEFVVSADACKGCRWVCQACAESLEALGAWI